jgi:two-component system OmpR family sensor kinase/two-component system sensor histidine kinase BaeS
MRIGLRTQLVLSFLLIAILTVGAVGFLTSRFTKHEFTAYVSTTGRVQAEWLTPLFAEYYARRGSWDGIKASIADLNENSSLEVFIPPSDIIHFPWDETNTENLRHWGEEQLHEFSWQQALWAVARLAADGEILLTDAQGTVIAGSSDENLGVRLTSSSLEQGAPVIVKRQQVGTVVIAARVDAFDPQESAFLKHVNQGLLTIGLGAIAVALVLGWWLAHRLSAPARDLTMAARDLAAGNWNQQLPVRSGDEFGQMTAAFNDMAAEITRQAALRRRLVADVAHELRTPLSVLRLELEATQDGLQPPQEAVAHVGEELVILESLIQDLSLLAQAEAGELPLNLQSEDLGALVENTVERWQGRAAARGLKLSAQVAPALPPLRLDRLRIGQVLTNLFSNALRHTPSGGRIEVQVRASDENTLLVSVRDTGEGIPPDMLPHIFERFYRADPARSRETGGAGLGLSIARQAVELHGGRLWAESELGAGSTFYFTLPVNPSYP